MSVRCPGCGREFDVTLFQYRRTVTCPCGAEVSLGEGHTERGGDGGRRGIEIDWEALEREIFRAEPDPDIDRGQAAAFRREADRIVSLILHSELPLVDIEIAIRAFRDTVLASFPEKEELFEALYLGRFRRIWEQFRDDDEELLPR
jgi:hypothetical protein